MTEKIFNGQTLARIRASLTREPRNRASFERQTIERFSYDREMKRREQNRNNKRTEIERFDWFIERIQTHLAFG